SRHAVAGAAVRDVAARAGATAARMTRVTSAARHPSGRALERPGARELRDWALVTLLFAVLATVTFAWQAIDRHPPEWDHANHLERAVLCARDLAAGDLGAVIARSSFYPPLVPCLAGVL